MYYVENEQNSSSIGGHKSTQSKNMKVILMIDQHYRWIDVLDTIVKDYSNLYVYNNRHGTNRNRRQTYVANKSVVADRFQNANKKDIFEAHLNRSCKQRSFCDIYRKRSKRGKNGRMFTNEVTTETLTI